MLKLQVLDTFRQSESDVGYRAHFLAARVSRLDNVEEHGVRNTIPHLVGVRAFELRDPQWVEVDLSVGVA